MPALSKRQFRAMQAAKHGKSTIGIPQSVGADFVAATPKPGKLPESAPQRRNYAKGGPVYSIIGAKS